MINYKSYFGFPKEPFAKDIPPDSLYQTASLAAATERFLYAVHLAAVAVITGEVGAGKSTTLRYAASRLHPSQYRLIPIVASTGSAIEVYRQIAMALDNDGRLISVARLTKTIRDILLDKLMYQTSKPLASRVVGRTHLEGLKLKDMAGYLKHHLEIAGLAQNLFADEAVLAIQQGSGGLPRRANALARGALVAAANEKSQIVTGEHVRLASTEII